MKEVLSTLTQRSQVTVPAEVRRILHLKPRDPVAFQIEDGQVWLVPVRFTVETAFGSVRTKSHPENFQAIAEAAKEEHVDQVVKKMRRRS